MSATKRAQPLETNGWVTSQEAAQYLGLTDGHLRNMRHLGTGPEYHKTNPSRNGEVRYRVADLDAWLTGRKP